MLTDFARLKVRLTDGTLVDAVKAAIMVHSLEKLQKDDPDNFNEMIVELRKLQREHPNKSEIVLVMLSAAQGEKPDIKVASRVLKDDEKTFAQVLEAVETTEKELHDAMLGNPEPVD